MEEKNIIIDLNDTDTKSFNDVNFIQIDARDKFIEKVKNFIKKIDDSKNEQEFERFHNTILIQGKRGYGKTSFILSVKEVFTPEICTLPIIDPTLIESKEHIFLNIVTHIKDKVEKKQKEQKNSKSDICKCWKESLKNLANGINMLDGVGTNHLNQELWDSPELVLEQGLSNSKHGYKLEENFHKYIDESLKILEKKAFCIILDDIDTSLKEGRIILETLRKYLTSKKLIVVLLGDIELYSTIVRQLQWEKIDPNKTLKEYEFQHNKEKYISQVEHLEEQYLTKVLKPENRINLKTLLELFNLYSHETNKFEIILINTKSEEISLNEFLYKMCIESMGNLKINNISDSAKSIGFSASKFANIIITSIHYIKNFKNILLSQPLRSILQILQAYDKYSVSLEFVASIRNTFFTTLNKTLKNSNLLEIIDKNMLFNYLSIYLLRENMTTDNHLKLIPNFKNSDTNITLFYLSVLLNESIKSKYYLTYFIKVGFVIEKYNNIENKTADELEDFINHIGLDSDGETLKIAQRLLTVSDKNNNNPIIFGGIVVSNDNLPKVYECQNISILLSSVSTSNGKKYILSFFNLLGFLSDILYSSFTILPKEIHSFQEYKKNNIINMNDITFNNEKLKNDKDLIESDEDLIKDLLEWRSEAFPKLSAFVLSAIWRRLKFIYLDIQNSKFNNYYEVIEMFIVGFLYSFNIEIKKSTNFEGVVEDIQISIFDILRNYKNSRSKKDYNENIIEKCPLFEIENSRFKYFKDFENITLILDKDNKTK